MSWIPWVQRILFVVLFTISIVLGAYTEVWGLSITYFALSIVLMFLAVCTRRLKWLSGFFIIFLLFYGVAFYFVLEILGNGSNVILYFNCFILLIITILIFHYYYTQWRYEELIQYDNFNPSDGKVHVLYFWHSLFLLIVSSIMLIVNLCYAEYFVFFHYFIWYYQLSISDFLRVIGVVFGYIAQKRKGIYFCTCYYRPLLIFASIIGILEIIPNINKLDHYFEEYRLFICNVAFETLIIVSALACNVIMIDYKKYKTI